MLNLQMSEDAGYQKSTYKRQLSAEGTIIFSAFPRKRDRGMCLIPCVSLAGYFQPGLNSTMNLPVGRS